ncbi:hypothetical protein [Neptuniibacter sp.]|uniref:hypothetical protein n=1 Tax=Neptuniibacter sp. TaxID=1962643 RepID=UPI0026089B0E|nr:hypothetical protein [Neptuniibacter sp.]MCP4596174.1 hypothetical protein [Neptuniibacter sp.]
MSTQSTLATIASKLISNRQSNSPALFGDLFTEDVAELVSMNGGKGIRYIRRGTNTSLSIQKAQQHNAAAAAYSSASEDDRTNLQPIAEC